MARLRALTALLAVAALASGVAGAKQRPPKPVDRAALVDQFPSPLWASSRAVTWERAGNPLSGEAVVGAPPADPPLRSLPRSEAAAAEAASVGDNPLLDDSAPFPRYSDVRPEHVLPGMRAVLAELNSALDKLEAGSGRPTYDGVLHPLERMTDKLERTWGVVTHLRSVRDTGDLRKAVTEVQPEVVAFELRLGQSRPLYEALQAIKDGEGWAKLTRTQQRVVDLQLRDLVLGGVALSPKDRARFNAIQQELAQLVTTFGNNILDSTLEFKKLLTKKDEVEGLGATALTKAAEDARGAGHAGATPAEGPWLFTLDSPSYTAVITYAKSRPLREEFYRAYNSRASYGAVDNGPVLDRLLALRREGAQLLGFPNFAERSFVTKMATLSSARGLLEEMRTAALPPAEKDLEDLRAFAASSQGFEGDLAVWDVSYWAEKLRASRYNLTDEELRPYLAFPNVLEGMFKLAKRLFGVDIVAADGAAPVWHPDVRFFEVRAANATPVAHFYVDPFSRPAEKRSGAWMDSVISRSKLMAPEGKSVRLPVALAICNQMAPVGDGPALMTFREVETLFHEFGHTLQHMLTTVDEGLVAGIRGVSWDAVELASQFMENWCYDRPTLMSFAKHHATGAPLPDEVFERIVAAKNFRSATGLIRQVNLATKDLELYSNYVPGGSETIWDVDRRVAARTLVMQPLADDRALCSFGHIFSGGYSAGYYSYKWSEVLSADAFAAFEEAGLGDESAIKATGGRYRGTVLALGGSVPPARVFEMFRGRGPSTAALLRHSGLAGAAA
ncbi:cytosolic oligopeptidase A-like protein [Raphidocelis subcapitata]|uniref:oligopeptidase A n=1 Tax=Raphidocelis subcapitata TaxID=307507 RepID=A0A2V0NRE1_9CHLO|nr:cytosolic oligopeptidase A-like protein [Raphidocelis subcapitata]|eukprot:GBF90216.1 cytosolic oligopeptidase A-like protein [Raphidocelis subcapitata]